MEALSFSTSSGGDMSLVPLPRYLSQRRTSNSPDVIHLKMTFPFSSGSENDTLSSGHSLSKSICALVLSRRTSILNWSHWIMPKGSVRV